MKFSKKIADAPTGESYGKIDVQGYKFFMIEIKLAAPSVAYGLLYGSNIYVTYAPYGSSGAETPSSLNINISTGNYVITKGVGTPGEIIGIY